MEALNKNRAYRWRKKPTSILRSKQLLSVSFFIILFSLLFFFSSKFSLNSIFSPSFEKFIQNPQCGRFKKQALGGERFLWYAPHSGFSNQLSEFKNAVLMAGILNRTLIVPPVLDHHAVVLGSCPKFRVTNPKELRFSVWNHAIELIRSRRYLSMADVIDLSSLVSNSAIRVIDFRNFVSLFCDVDVDFSCFKDSSMQGSLLENVRQCGSLLSGYHDNVNDCVYTVEDDCRTTVWTFQGDGEDGALDSFQPDEQLKKKKKISFIRRRRDVYNTLGPGSTADLATVLSFGTLFTSPYKGSESYIDIHEAPRDRKIQSLMKKLEFLPFVPEILNAGKEYALHTIKSPFLCAQLRLLDGQFKNHWKATFQGLKQKLESLRQKGNLPINIFVMTDLPMSNWTGTFLGDLSKDSDSFKLVVLREDDELIRRTAKKVVESRHGMRFRADQNDGNEKQCSSPRVSPDILLHVEETVCSCASLGFYGTAGSTIADSIEIMRKYQICSG